MSRPVRAWSPLSRGVLVSIVLHGGIVVLLSLKPRVVTLTIGPESGLMHATLIAVPTNHLLTARPLSAPKASQQSAEQPPRRVEPPPRPAEKPPLKRVKAEKNSPTIEPSKDSTTGQLVKSAQAPPPPLKQATAAIQKKVKGTLVEGGGSTTSKNDGKTASTTTPQTSADLDRFFGHLAASTGTGSAQLASTQQCNHYATQIKSAIQANLIKEQEYQGRSCEIALQLAADGTIVRAEARQGDRLVCAAALRAVGITERVPKPPDPVLYELFKAIVISFEF